MVTLISVPNVIATHSAKTSDRLKYQSLFAHTGSNKTRKPPSMFVRCTDQMRVGEILVKYCRYSLPAEICYFLCDQPKTEAAAAALLDVAHSVHINSRRRYAFHRALLSIFFIGKRRR